jgi:hypothetical protein
MKTLLMALSLIVLSGCAVVDRFIIAPFDPNEYALVNSLRSTSIQVKPNCSNISRDEVNQLYNIALNLKNYSQYLPRNDQTIKPVNTTYQMVSELKTRYNKENKLNKTYCELKIQSIIDATELTQRALGKRPR